MKIRLFNEYDSNPYKKITKEEYLFQKNLDFDIFEINFIKRNFGDYINSISKRQISLTNSCMIFEFEHSIIFIYKIEDDYFLVTNDNDYYKCDQLEGLKKLINILLN